MRDQIAGAAFAWRRLGKDEAAIRRHLELTPTASTPTWRDRVKGWLFGPWRERFIRRLLGEEYVLLQLGRFRRGGEIHHGMYDRVSLRDLLTQAGFVNFRCVKPIESTIEHWSDYHLDVDADGIVCKPDSLFVEAERKS